jgi:hypothetical protein
MFSSYKEYLIKDNLSNIPNIHINIYVPNIDFTFHIKRSTNSIGSYIVMNPASGKNGADLAFLAPTLRANNLLEIGVDFEEFFCHLPKRRSI